jgi:hypothetical protein
MPMAFVHTSPELLPNSSLSFMMFPARAAMSGMAMRPVMVVRLIKIQRDQFGNYCFCEPRSNSPTFHSTRFSPQLTATLHQLDSTLD